MECSIPEKSALHFMSIERTERLSLFLCSCLNVKALSEIDPD